APRRDMLMLDRIIGFEAELGDGSDCGGRPVGFGLYHKRRQPLAFENFYLGGTVFLDVTDDVADFDIGPVEHVSAFSCCSVSIPSSTSSRTRRAKLPRRTVLAIASKVSGSKLTGIRRIASPPAQEPRARRDRDPAPVMRDRCRS